MCGIFWFTFQGDKFHHLRESILAGDLLVTYAELESREWAVGSGTKLQHLKALPCKLSFSTEAPQPNQAAPETGKQALKYMSLKGTFRIWTTGVHSRRASDQAGLGLSFGD